MSRVTIRMWTAEGYHRDVATLSEEQVHSFQQGMECRSQHAFTSPIGAVRIVVDPKQFPGAVEFEVIVERCKER